jgi:hypothetical protein
MKRFITIIILSLIITTAYSQRSYLGLSFGGSIPGEEFAKKSLVDDGGYALPGFVIDFSAAYIFDYYFGITGTLTFSNNSIDRQKFGEDIIEGLQPVQLPQETEVDIKVGNWMYTNIMVGPLLTLPVWKLNFDIHGVAGLSIMLSPPQEINARIDNEYFFERRSNQAVNFAYMLGTGIRYNMNEATALRLSADYFRSKPSFTSDQDGLIYAITEKSSYDMNIGAIHINIGIAWRF